MTKKSNILMILKRKICNIIPLKKSRQPRNSDLHQHSFKLAAEPGRPRKKRSFTSIREKVRRKRAEQNTHYSTHRVSGRRWQKIVPTGVVLVMLAFFFSFDGPTIVGSLCADFSLFKVRSVSFSGCQASSENRLLELTGITLFQSSLLGLDKGRVQAAVEQDPWVSRARVKRDWPSAIVVEVTEHRPLALLNKVSEGAPQLYYIDKKGVPFKPVTAGQDVDFPVITGLDSISDPQQRLDLFKEVRLFLSRARRNDPNLPAQSISEIHVNEAGEMVIYLVEHPFPIYFGKGDTATKYDHLVKVLRSLYKEQKNGILLSGVKYIRMDYYNNKVLVKQSESG